MRGIAGPPAHFTAKLGILPEPNNRLGDIGWIFKVDEYPAFLATNDLRYLSGVCRGNDRKAYRHVFEKPIREAIDP